MPRPGSGQSRPSIANVPNFLTFFRILLIPGLVVLLLDQGPAASYLAAFTFFLACLSDFLDGYVARRFEIVTPIGKLLDPLADKLLVMAALVMLCAGGREPRVPAWLVVLVVGREISVTGLRAIAISEGYLLGAEELGKYKMILQMFALHGLLIHYPLFGVDFHAAGMYFLWLSVIVAVWSAADYHAKVISRAMG